MKLSQMFPKATLDAADLAAYYQGTSVVTIERIDYRTFAGKKPGDAEIAYYLHTREFKKPFRIGPLLARMIEGVLKSDDTDEWIGRTIGLRPIYQRFVDRDSGHAKNVWVFDIDIQPPATPPQLPPKTDITGMAGQIKGGPLPGVTAGPARPALAGGAPVVANPNDASPMGADKAAAMLGAIGERGKTCDDLIKHMSMAGMSHLVAGKIPPDWPVSIIPTVHGFCRSFPKVKPPADAAALERFKAMWQPPAAAPPTEVIDRQTGEVQEVAGRIGVEPIDEEDIPF